MIIYVDYKLADIAYRGNSDGGMFDTSLPGKQIDVKCLNKVIITSLMSIRGHRSVTLFAGLSIKV